MWSGLLSLFPWNFTLKVPLTAQNCKILMLTHKNTSGFREGGGGREEGGHAPFYRSFETCLKLTVFPVLLCNYPTGVDVLWVWSDVALWP